MLMGHPTAHVYLVELTGDYEDDPNVTDRKFPEPQPAHTGLGARC